MKCGAPSAQKKTKTNQTKHDKNQNTSSFVKCNTTPAKTKLNKNQPNQPTNQPYNHPSIHPFIHPPTHSSIKLSNERTNQPTNQLSYQTATVTT